MTKTVKVKNIDKANTEPEEILFVTDEWMRSLFIDHGRPTPKPFDVEPVNMRRMSKMKVR